MILTSGCFDGIHAGHVAFLDRVRQVTAQPLYVAVASDAYIRRAKGHDPRWGEQERVVAIRGLRSVTDAFLHDEQGVWNVLRGGMPWAGGASWAAFAKGLDWIGKFDLVADICRSKGTALIFVDSGCDLHSSTR